jgi:REP element-mobilizing transposase RayT
MANRSRKQSQADIYHVTVRGVSRALIFEDDADRNFFLAQLSKMLESTGGELLAWCLMSNHAHLLFRMEIGKLSEGMKRFESSYATYFNKRHSRIGHLFQDRYRSEPVNTTGYFLRVFRYILRNPVKAGLGDVMQYPWSSWPELQNRTRSGICRIDTAVAMAGNTRNLMNFVLTDNNDVCLENTRRHFITDAEATELIMNRLDGKTPLEIAELPIENRNSLLLEWKAEGLSIRQISRITGINRNTVQRVCSAEGHGEPEGESRGQVR